MIDTSTWKEFRVGDYFEVTYGTFKAKSESVDEGGTPHITTTQYNNGIGYYVKEQMFPAHCITVASDGCQGASFYHTYPISASNIVSVCVPHDDVQMNETIGNFLCSLFRKEGEKYSWGGFKYSVDRVRETRLHLPATSDGQPDWDYMESYMKAVMEESEKNLENLRKADDTKHLIDVSGWGEFRVGDLFDIHPTSSYKVTNVELLNDNGRNPVVANSGFNNGIVGYTDYECNENAGVITFTDTAAKSSESFFYQKDIFVGYPHVQGMYCKQHDLNEYEGKYMTTVLRSAAGKFDFITKMTREVVNEFVIKLPITSTGDPDWQYMEDYMQRIMDNSEQIISDLQIGA